MTPEPRRRRLRERVAARKAGLAREGAGGVSGRAWRRWLRRIGMGAQILTFFLLLVEIYRMFEAGFVVVDATLIVIYLVVFFIGRFLQVIAGLRRH